MNNTEDVSSGDFSPNAIEEHSGDKECNHNSGCHKNADWDVYLINGHGQSGLIRACDEHVEDIYGYHPEEKMSNSDVFSTEDRETLQRAVDKWGIEAQADMAEEECAEFIAASKHHRRDKVPVEDVIDELADIRIMYEQLALFFGQDIVENRVNEKMNRLRERIEDDDV